MAKQQPLPESIGNVYTAIYFIASGLTFREIESRLNRLPSDRNWPNAILAAITVASATSDDRLKRELQLLHDWV